MLQIKNQLRKMIADGNKLDLVVLDYIDCVMPEKSYGDEWKSTEWLKTQSLKRKLRQKSLS